MADSLIPITDKEWLIISWSAQNEVNKYGRLIDTVYGTREEAEEQARQYLADDWKLRPIGIVETIP